MTFRVRRMSRLKVHPKIAGQEVSRLGSWKQQAQRLQREAHTFYLAFKHPRVPWFAKFIAACIAGYLFSPIQLIPSYIPVIGFLDDFLVLFLGARLLKRIIPPDVFAECREAALAAETRRKKEIRSVAGAVALIVIVSAWPASRSRGKRSSGEAHPTLAISRRHCQKSVVKIDRGRPTHMPQRTHFNRYPRRTRRPTGIPV